MRGFGIGALSCLFALSLAPAASHAGSWVKTGGPIGGLGYDIRINPSTKNIMLVTDNWSGVNRSSNTGATWVSSNSGILIRSGSSGNSVPIFSLTIDPNDPNIVWAGTQGQGADFGVYKSADAGVTWSLMVNGISLETDIGLVFRGFTIQSGNSNTVYAMAEVPTAVNGKEFNRTKGRIYKTVDGGANWVKIWKGDNLARYLIINPADPNMLYASTGIFDREANNSDCTNGIRGGVGVIKSADGGTTWNAVNTGLADLYVGSLRMHPSNPDILFAATGNNACSADSGGGFISGLFKTANGGGAWTKVVSNDILTTVNFSTSNPLIVYAGSSVAFYRSQDGGTTWSTLRNSGGIWGPAGIRAGVPIDVTVSYDDANTLYANAYGGGLFKSTDGANTWVAWSKGYTGADLHGVDVDPTTSGLVYVIGRSGPFKSANGGDDWTGIATGGASGIPEWYSIRQKPDDTAIIIVTDEHQGVIFRSIDSGATFTEVLRHPSANAGSSLTRQGFKALAFAPSDTRIVYAGLAKDRNTVDTTVPVGTVTYVSSDAGATWAAKPSVLDGKNINMIVVGAADPKKAFAATTGGMFSTSDGASSWSQLNGLGNADIRAVAIDPSNPLILFAASEKVGIFKSADGGATWAGPKNTGFSSANPQVRGIVVAPAGSAAVYAGDWTSGVYMSADGGETWAPFPDSAMTGLSTRAVKSMAISADGKVLYAATQGEGLFRYGTPAAATASPPATTVTTASAGGGGKSGCFIATAAYGNNMDWHVTVLKRFRDDHLLTNVPGRMFVEMYNRYSPALADKIRNNGLAKNVVMALLLPIVYCAAYPGVLLGIMAMLILSALLARKRVKIKFRA